MPLQHIHLPVLIRDAVRYYPTYALAVEIQSRLQRRVHQHKAALSSPSQTASPPPSPTLLSFTPAPTYTLGRRQTAPLTPAESARLAAPLLIRDRDGGSRPRAFLPTIVNAPRGGLATYHGPGQVVFWPVIDLHSPLHRELTVRDYACLLEKTTIAALAETTRPVGAGEVKGFTTDNPGVWVRHSSGGLAGSTPDTPGAGEGEERKIAALGVHLRRHVTGLGVAVNISMPVTGAERLNPWARIVACGLEDKRVTSVGAEVYGEQWESDGADRSFAAAVRQSWSNEFGQRLGLLSAGKLSTGENEALVVSRTAAEILGSDWLFGSKPGEANGSTPEDWLRKATGYYYSGEDSR